MNNPSHSPRSDTLPPEPPKILDRVLAELHPTEPHAAPGASPLPPPKSLVLPKAPPGASSSSRQPSDATGRPASGDTTADKPLELKDPVRKAGELPVPDDDPTGPRAAVWGAALVLLLLFLGLVLYGLRGLLVLPGPAEPPDAPSASVTQDTPPSPVGTEPTPRPADRSADESLDEAVWPESADPATGRISALQVSAPALAVSKLLLCREVTGYGLFETIPDIPLTARHVPLIEAYVEFVDPEPEPREDGRHNYYLTKDIKLYRSDTGPSEPLIDSTVSLVFRGMSPRRDFYSTQRLRPARRLEPGSHTLVVRLTDQVSGAVRMERTTLVIHPE